MLSVLIYPYRPLSLFRLQRSLRILSPGRPRLSTVSALRLSLKLDPDIAELALSLELCILPFRAVYPSRRDGPSSVTL